MTVIRTTPDRVGFLIRKKDREVRAALRPAAIASANATLRRVVRDSPVDQAVYKNSWEVEVGAQGSAILAILANDSPHAGIIERGARPFVPPLGPLIEWVERKFGDLGLAGPKGLKRTKVKVGGRSYRGRASLTDEQRAKAFAVARAIQRKIAQRGLPPKRVMGKNLAFARRQFKKEFERLLGDIARRE